MCFGAGLLRKEESPDTATAEVVVNGTVYHPTVKAELVKVYKMPWQSTDSIFQGLLLHFSFYIADSFYSCALFREQAREVKTNVYDSGAFYISWPKQTDHGYATRNTGIIHFYDAPRKRITLTHRGEFTGKDARRREVLVKLVGQPVEERTLQQPARGPF